MIGFSDATSTPTAELNGLSFTSGTTVSNEGNYQLVVTDEAGTTVNFSLDKKAPTGTVSGPTHTNITNVTLNLISDDGTGVGGIHLLFSNVDSDWSAWEEALATWSWSLASGDGTKTVYMQ